jgi:branched-chain amino acid transport system substrate-binding protein
VDGERLALSEAGGRAGGLRVRLRELPATDADTEDPWDPALVDTNAHRAADDPSAIAYLGEFDYGASAVSLPITNEAGLLQISPADGLTSLTQRPPGRPRAGPERYYPSGERSFVRVGPTDLLEAEHLVDRLRAGGAERIGVVFDRDIYSRELAAQIVTRARRDGLEPVASEEYRGKLDEIPDIARGLAEGGPEALIHAGVAGRGTGRLLAALALQLPGVPLYATSGILARPPSAPIPVAPARVEALRPAMSPRRAGYEAMRLVLDAIEAGGRDRRRVIEAALRLGRQAETHRFGLYRLDGDGRFRRVGTVP